jgi:uncharacterized membrane protein YraQ (UPF0718 family)
VKIKTFIKNNKLLTAVFLVYLTLFFTMPDKAVFSVKNSTYYIIEMLKIMPVVFVLSSIIEAWVPRDVIIKNFGDQSGIKGNVLSFVLGSISAGPIYAAFPVCKMLLRKGASIVNIIIILSAWAVIKIPMLINEAKFLSPRFMAIRWVLTIISIVIIAHIVPLFVKKEDLPQDTQEEIEGTGEIAIQEQYCVGCGICANLLPEYFEMIDKKAKSKGVEVEKQELKRITRILEKCPVNAISLTQAAISEHLLDSH